jgi:isoquinoline 1-oxidoreductase subunit beta
VQQYIDLPNNRKASKQMSKITRRIFLGSTTIAIAGFGLGVGFLNNIDIKGAESKGLRGAAQRLNAFIEILPDGRVRALIARAEMGQGAQMGVATLIAEELDLPLSKIQVEHPTELLPAYINTLLAVGKRPELLSGPFDWATQRVFSTFPFIGTGGSTTMADAWVPIRLAAATARALLVQAAAQLFSVPASELAVADGIVRHTASKQQAHYGQLAAAAAKLPLPAAPTLKTAANYKLIGKEGQSRVDLPSKVDGTAIFGIDVKVPKMRIGALLHAPQLGATLLSVDASAISGTPGDVRIVKGKNYVAAVGTSYWFASQALMALKIEWSAGSNINSAEVRDTLQGALAGITGDGREVKNLGQTMRQLESASRKIDALYEVPYLAHICMEPMNATAWMKDDGTLEVWAPIQSPTAMKLAAAKVLGSAPKNATYHTTFLGGGFGRRGERDYVERAIEVAAALPGIPVKLIWSREQDMRNDMYRPAAMARLRGALDERGELLALDATVALQSVRSDSAKRNLPYPIRATSDPMNVEGLQQIPYRLPNFQLTNRVVKLPIPVGSWRAVGNSQNGFFAESFIDEMAYLAKADPMTFRLQHLSHDGRWLALAKKLKETSNWDTPLAPGSGRGVAFVESFRSLMGEVVEVSVMGGKVKVERVVCVIDCGTVVNPDVVRAQVASGVIFGLSAALYGKTTFTAGSAIQGNFDQQPVLMMRDTPLINVHMMASIEAPSGVGEPSTPPIFAALTNAVFAATGNRYRKLPLSEHGLV